MLTNQPRTAHKQKVERSHHFAHKPLTNNRSRTKQVLLLRSTVWFAPRLPVGSPNGFCYSGGTFTRDCPSPMGVHWGERGARPNERSLVLSSDARSTLPCCPRPVCLCSSDGSTSLGSPTACSIILHHNHAPRKRAARGDQTHDRTLTKRMPWGIYQRLRILSLKNGILMSMGNFPEI